MPVFVGTLIYLFLDHRNARTGFGGNEGILDWVGWIFTQPATFLFAIPAIGMLVEIFPITFGKRTPARGVMFAGLGPDRRRRLRCRSPSRTSRTCRGRAAN